MLQFSLVCLFSLNMINWSSWTTEEGEVRQVKTPESQSTASSAFQISALFCFGALRLICTF